MEHAALPSGVDPDGKEQVTAVACPDCSGTLTVRAMGKLILFRCRIGHVYAVPELLASKERRLEERMWSAVAALDELAALLHDLGYAPERRERAERYAA